MPKVRSARDSERQKRPGREESTRRILDAAEELFATKNPLLVTVRDVAEKAGVTHALVHQYIGTKDDLINAVVLRAAPQRQQAIVELPDYRTIFPLLIDDVLVRRFHTRSMLRAAMDGVKYSSLETPIDTGRMLIELAEKAAAPGALRQPQPDAMDMRIVLAGVVSMAYGWAGGEDWLAEIFDLQDENPDWVRAQLVELAACIAEFVFPPGEERSPQLAHNEGGTSPK